MDIVYTYDVHWQPSQIKWASRWDAYLRMPGGKVGLLLEAAFIVCFVFSVSCFRRMHWQLFQIKWDSCWDAHLHKPGGKVGLLLRLTWCLHDVVCL